MTTKEFLKQSPALQKKSVSKLSTDDLFSMHAQTKNGVQSKIRRAIRGRALTTDQQEKLNVITKQFSENE